MRLTLPSVVLSLSYLTVLVSGHSGHDLLRPRKASILISPEALPELPSAQQAKTAAAAADLNLDDVQGDILIGMKKDKELFFFFSIEDVATFKSKLGSDIAPLVTSTTQLLPGSDSPTTALNVAFSQSGLVALNVTDPSGGTDQQFNDGQAKDASSLGDAGGTANWVDAFVGTSIHGVFLLASNTLDNLNTELANIQTILGASVSEKHRLQGQARPSPEFGHEHFGFMDGISQPAVKGFLEPPFPGQIPVDPGVILAGEANDPVTNRPAWAKDGSFLAFRQLKQLVPEFNKFLTDNPIVEPGVLTPEQGSALLGARMMGRWKSGAPIDLTPLNDDPVLANDTQRNNNFTFAGETDQSKCPFSAHVRKTNPRADLNFESTHHIIRAGIPYGPEVTDDEAASNTTSTERGLAFVSYQSQLNVGFRFIQTAWANSNSFLRNTGADPIIGAQGGASRTITGLDPTNSTRPITLFTDFVVSRGGEYFFSPSISAIKNTLAA